MSNLIETQAQAWERRAAIRGEVDFTMMYVGHDAFCRDLDRLLRASERGALLTPQGRGTWELFSRMLHMHHGAEDVSLWPKLRAAVSDPLDVETLDAMELEHASLDPLLDAITAGYAEDRADDIAEDLDLLSRRLRAHMLHEENDALPLLERTLGAEGWTTFGEEVRSRAGARDMPTMLSWMLDDATPAAAQTVLAMLPPPVRTIYRHVWAPRYRRTTVLR